MKKFEVLNGGRFRTEDGKKYDILTDTGQIYEGCVFMFQFSCFTTTIGGQYTEFGQFEILGIRESK